MAANFGSIAIKALSDNKGTIGKSSLVIVTAALEQLSSKNLFYCPCVEPIQVTNCSVIVNQTTTAKCPPNINVAYSFAFGIAPTFFLFFVSLAISAKLWRTWTGLCFRHKSTLPSHNIQGWNLLSIFGQAAIAPVTWLCISLVDGTTFACGLAPMPYDVGPGAKYASCSVVPNASPLYSAAFKHYKSLSQVIGLHIVAILLFLTFIIYSISSCFNPLTYYHAKYYKLYQEHEESEFDDEMHKKTRTQAESNIRKFMAKERQKFLWDRVSNVFNLHRETKNPSSYSYLHQCITDEERQNSESESLDDDDHASNYDTTGEAQATDH